MTAPGMGRERGIRVFRLKSMRRWVVGATLLLGLTTGIPSLAQNRRNDRNQRPRQQQPQGHHAGQWLRQYKDMPPDQQRRALESDPQFRNLPPERQQQLRGRLQRFSSMPPEQQQRVLNRMETWEHLTPDQKQQARQVYSQMQQLPPDRRQAMQTEINRLRAMPPDARQREIDSESNKSRFTPPERDLLNGASKLPLAPPETERGEEGPEE